MDIIGKIIKRGLLTAYTLCLILLAFLLISSFGKSFALASDGDIGTFDTTNQGQTPAALFPA